MTRTRPWAILLVLCLGTFAILLDTTIVNVALPSLITSLHASLDQALWVVNGYLLVFCALLIVASRLGDRFGRRRLFMLGLAVFALASALCGAAQNPGELIAARVLQGIGAAALAPQPMAIIQDVFPRDRMGAAFGIFSSMVGLAAVSGPVLGGVLTTYLSWRWVFYVNLPIAATGIVLALRLVPELAVRRRHRLDVPGVLLSSTGLAAVVYGLIEGQRYHWGTVAAGITVGEIIAAGVVVLAGFVIWERRQGEPLLPLSLFGSRAFAIMVVLNVIVQFALQSMLLINSINLQSVLGFTAVHGGLTGLPLTIALTALAPFAGRLTDRLGGKFVLITGLVVYAAGIAGLATMAMRAAQGGLQVGRGQQTTAAVPRGAPAALAATLRRLTGDVFAHGYITAMRPTLAVSAGLLLAGAVFCLLLPRRTAPVTPAPVADADAAPAQVSGEQAG